MNDFQIKLRYTDTTQNFDDGDFFEFTKKKLAKKIEWIGPHWCQNFTPLQTHSAHSWHPENWQSSDKKPVGCAGLLVSAWHGRARCWCGEGRDVASVKFMHQSSMSLSMHQRAWEQPCLFWRHVFFLRFGAFFKKTKDCFCSQIFLETMLVTIISSEATYPTGTKEPTHLPNHWSIHVAQAVRLTGPLGGDWVVEKDGCFLVFPPLFSLHQTKSSWQTSWISNVKDRIFGNDGWEIGTCKWKLCSSTWRPSILIE